MTVHDQDPYSQGPLDSDPDETAEWQVLTSWGEALRDGTAAGLGIYHVSDNAQLDRLDILIDWSTP